MSTQKNPDRSGFSALQLSHLAGVALIGALPLQVVGFLLHPPSEELRHVTQATYGTAHTVLFLSWVLALLGLPALYVAQSHRAGKLGLAGFVVTMSAVAYHLYLTLYEASAIPVVAVQPGAEGLVGDGGALAHGAGALGPLAGILLLGFPLLGVATVRAGVLPRSVGWLQVACLPTFVALMLGIGAVTGGAVGPEATSWIGGMLPIASLYGVLFSGYALGGQALRARSVGVRSAAVPAARDGDQARERV